MGVTVATAVAAAMTVTTLAACGSSPPAAEPVPATAPAALQPPVVDGEIATGLGAPWGIAFLPDGTALVSERDSGRVLALPAGGGQPRDAGVVPGIAHGGEGGLLGLAVDPEDASGVLAYVTTEQDNRVVRLDWTGERIDPASAREIITGIPRADIHNGGRIAIGPDGMLYVATGDAGEPDLAQDPASLAGKILRVAPDGSVPADNPTPGSPVWSLGHRNVQGLAFDDAGRLWATEFGSSSADELNLIVAGGNYGWPLHEGAAGDPEYRDPLAQWSPTSLASPSGLAILDDIAYVASLRGEVLWAVPLVGDRAAEPVALDLGDLGRLRTIVVAPDGSLWLATSNTDGRGEPRALDDRILRLRSG